MVQPPNTMEGDFTLFRTKPKGLETRLLDVIAKAANFSYVYKFPKKAAQGVGVIKENGCATGLMKMLLEKEVDIIMGSINPTITRHKFFDFSYKYGSVSGTWTACSNNF